MKIYIVVRARGYDFDEILYAGPCEETAKATHKDDEFGTMTIHEIEVEAGRVYIDTHGALVRVVATDGPEGLENFVHRIGLSGRWYAAGQISNEKLATFTPREVMK